MKIALIAPGNIPARTANSIQTMKMAQAFTQLGHAVRLLVPGSNMEHNFESLAAHYGLEESFGIEWFPVNPAMRGYAFAAQSVRSASRWGADLVFTRVPQVAALASSAGLNTIYEMHDLPQGTMGPRLMRRFLNGSGAKKLVCISYALSHDLYTLYRVTLDESFTVIAPDGVDLERYQGLPTPIEARKMLKLGSRFTAGYTGHLYAGRGVDLILDLAKRLPSMDFLLVGGEPKDVKRVEELAVKNHLANVTLTGFVPNSDLPRYQAACDVLLMPYQEEVAASSGGDISRYLSPMKMFEYLAAGRAILASDLPVLQEILTEKNAIILPADKPAEWAKTLEKLRNDRRIRKRLSEAALQTAEQYTWTARAERILEGLE